MRRRKFITLLGGTATALASRVARAQSAGKVWRLGFLHERPPLRAFAGFVEALRELGYIDGQNLTIQDRSAAATVERLPGLAAELVRLKPDVIAAISTQALIALQRATSTIPIVMILPGDPVAVGLVKSLAYPGGNITGTSLMMPDISGKRLGLLKEIVPTLRRLVILGNTQNAATAAEMRETEAIARRIDLQVHVVGVESPDRLDDTLSGMMNEKPEGLVVALDSLVFSFRGRIAEFARQNHLPSVVPSRDFVESGGLVGYGPNVDAIARRAATYVDRILKGAKPADLPVEQPTIFELTVNLGTAKALGITFSPSLLARANEVIE